MISGLNEFRILDLFCGAGGLSWGMHKIHILNDGCTGF